MKNQSNIMLIPTNIADVFIVEPKVIDDEFGWCMESFNAEEFGIALGRGISFVQENQAFSNQWTLRGIHYQKEQPQGKLVSVVQGLIFDVVVDTREKSETYGQWFGAELSELNHKQIWLPPGLAHGFLVLSSTAEVLYKVTDYYHPQSEVCLAWNDSEVAIQWPLPDGVHPILSAKDRRGLSLKQLSEHTQ